MTDLGTHKGRDVVAVGMKLIGAGDGLSEAMHLDPIDLNFGQRVHIVIEAVVTKDEHGPAIKGDLFGPLREVLVLKAEAATIVENSTVAKIIDKHKRELNKAREIDREIDGQLSLDEEGNDDDGE